MINIATVPRRACALTVLAFAGVIACGTLSLLTGGRSDIGLADLFFPSGLEGSVMWEIRVPRTLTAACIGINLALSGLILQAITRNPLSSPSILGINQGAALGLTLGVIVPAVGSAVGLKTLAASGAFLAGLVTFSVAGGFQGRLDGLRLVLGGVAVGAFASALVRFSFTLEDDLARQVLQWTLGNISDMRWHHVQGISWWSLGGICATLFLAHRLNLMALGEAQTSGLGVDPRLTLLIGAIIAACLTGVSVSVAGPIAFVGLVVPHMCRLAFGHDYRVLVPATALTGACLLTAADGASKLLTAPVDLPVGVVVSILGAPYFLFQTLFSKEQE
jgi:iron complex transport system permease protein